jgi:hypothetical protein
VPDRLKIFSWATFKDFARYTDCIFLLLLVGFNKIEDDVGGLLLASPAE